MAEATPDPRGLLTIPPLYRQSIFLLTGSFAGACTVPVSALLAHSTSVPVLVPILRTAPRFWAFDITRTNLPSSLPVSLAGGVSGATGGAFEILCHSLVAKRALPDFHAVASHSGRLFLGFGTFTGLSSFYSTDFPPKPFFFSWFLGSIAGAVGTGIGTLLENKGRLGLMQLAKATGTGAAIVGVVISVQVTSCSRILNLIESQTTLRES